MLTLKIIYEDEDILAVDKPAGVVVHRDQFTPAGEVTIADWLLEKYPTAQLAHRLDKDTTGVLLIAKNQIVHDYFKKLFQTDGIKKRYLALVFGQPPGGIIDLPVGRSRRDPRRRIAGRGAVGKLREAVTEYSVLENLGDYSMVEAWPKTGRTHQIRVHFKAIGYPIVGDALYSPVHQLANLPFVLNRQALHATSVEFISPAGKVLKIESALPDDLAGVLKRLRSLSPSD